MKRCLGVSGPALQVKPTKNTNVPFAQRSSKILVNLECVPCSLTGVTLGVDVRDDLTSRCSLRLGPILVMTCFAMAQKKLSHANLFPALGHELFHHLHQSTCSCCRQRLLVAILQYPTKSLPEEPLHCLNRESLFVSTLRVCELANRCELRQ
jgi:hypothetical protein